jgi:hypothetical protein
MSAYQIPDLTGWQAYCETCKEFRETRRAEDRDASTDEEYFEWVCLECHSILLTFERSDPAERIRKRRTLH